ncbi:IS1595 family transposase [candidate division WOR-3 bacterium]|nr:IS1595 family transposase [candidate division WOR-3 bacterium]
MNIPEILKITRSERSSFKYLEKLRWLGKVICPKCGSSNAKKPDLTHKDTRYRCNVCHSRFTVFTDTYLTGCKIKPSKLILSVKLYTLELPVSVISKELGLNYKTVLSLIDKIRQTILVHNSSRKSQITIMELEKSYITGKPDKNGNSKVQIPVFGIREQDGKVSVDVIYNVGRLGNYDFLIVDGHNRMKVDTYSKEQINLIDSFWMYAKERLLRHRGVAPGKLPLYMKELEFRFNNIANDSTEQTILGYLLSTLPDKTITN